VHRVEANSRDAPPLFAHCIGERKRFASAIPPAWARDSPRVAGVVALLYLHGLSSSDFGPALTQFLGI